MNKWTELLIGLVFVIVVVLEWGLNLTGLEFGTAALTVFKGGIIWGVLMIGLLFVMLGISDIKE